jgi:hypothetical protein
MLVNPIRPQQCPDGELRRGQASLRVVRFGSGGGGGGIRRKLRSANLIGNCGPKISSLAISGIAVEYMCLRFRANAAINRQCGVL